MNLVDVLLLSLVEGLTEFIPVSSTGHLILLSHRLNLTSPQAKTFEVVIQLGAILAVVALYPGRFLALWPRGAAPADGFRGLRGITLLAVACLPAFISGALLHSTIKERLFAPGPVAWALIVGGVVLLIIERVPPLFARRRPGTASPPIDSLDAIDPKRALIVGLFQCLALWPGISRSAATVVGGLMCGMTRRLAAEFSFLVAVPVMAAAASYDLLKSWKFLGQDDLIPFATGLVASFVVAAFAIKLFLYILQRASLSVFGAYRIVLGIVVLWMLGS